MGGGEYCSTYVKTPRSVATGRRDHGKDDFEQLEKVQKRPVDLGDGGGRARWARRQSIMKNHPHQHPSPPAHTPPNQNPQPS